MQILCLHDAKLHHNSHEYDIAVHYVCLEVSWYERPLFNTWNVLEDLCICLT
jgi:hypothetical protein